MKRLILLLFLLLLQPAPAETYHYQPSTEGWSVRTENKEVELKVFLASTGVKVRKAGTDSESLVEVDGRVGLVREDKLIVPPLYRALGMTTYVGELGWVHSGQTFYGITGFQAEDGRWGLLDERGRQLSAPTHQEILYDGYFFSGNLNPLEGMEACRNQALAKGEDILCFALQDRRAVGYFTSGGVFVSFK